MDRDLLRVPKNLRKARQRYQYGCRNKCKYQTQRSAQRAIVAMFARGEYLMIEYRCSFCEMWHIGHFNMRQFSPITLFEKQKVEQMIQKTRSKS